MGASNYYLAIIDLDAMSRILVHTAKLQLKMQITSKRIRFDALQAIVPSICQAVAPCISVCLQVS